MSGFNDIFGWTEEKVMKVKVEFFFKGVASGIILGLLIYRFIIL